MSNSTNKLDLNKSKYIKAGLNIVDGDEFKEAFLNVSSVSASILEKTFGPYAATTIIDDGTSMYSTKDGWSIAHRLSFADPLHTSLFEYIKNISYNTVSKVGDGTTTAIVAANCFINELNKNIDKFDRLRQRDILETVNKVKESIIEKLESDKYRKYISDKNFEDIYKIAYTSSNGNEEVSRMIQDIYKQTENPHIIIDSGASHLTKSEILMGYRLESSPRALNIYINTRDNEFKPTKRPLMMFFNHNLSYTDHIKILNVAIKRAQKENRICLLFAPHFDDVLSGEIFNIVKQCAQERVNIPLMMIQVPLTGNTQKTYFEDVMLINKTSAFDATALRIAKGYINDKHLKTKEELKEDEDPFAFKDKAEDELLENAFEKYESLDEFVDKYIYTSDCDVTVNVSHVLFNDFDTESEIYKNTLESAKNDMIMEKDKANQTYAKMSKAEMSASQRYNRLLGKVGIIHIGGETDLERRCLKDSVDDAVLACKSAYEHGYVKGLNISMLGAIKDCKNGIKKLNPSDDDKINLMVLDILYATYREVSYKVMRNKYDNGDTEKVWKVTGHSSSEEYVKNSEILDIALYNNKGYDIVKEEFTTDDNLTVINSVRTDIEVLSAMISIITYMMTSNQLLSIKRVYDKAIQKEITDAELYSKHKIIAEAMNDGFGINEHIKFLGTSMTNGSEAIARSIKFK